CVTRPGLARCLRSGSPRSGRCPSCSPCCTRRRCSSPRRSGHSCGSSRITVGFAARRVMRVAAPVVAAVGGWVLFNAARTGDAFRFFDAKSAWHEITVLSLVERPTPDALLHITLAGIAVALVLVGRRRFPPSWSWFTVLYLLPSLAFGVVDSPA